MVIYNSDKILNARHGKVRDVLETKDHILLIATDRISAFDVVMPDEIPGKGELLTKLSRWWFDYFKQIPNHLTRIVDSDFYEIFPDETLVEGDLHCYPPLSPGEREAAGLKGRRSMWGRLTVCKKAKVIPLEFVVRGYITGSLWKDYEGKMGHVGPSKPSGMGRAKMRPAVYYPPYTFCGLNIDRGMKHCQEFPEPIFTPATKAPIGEHDENISFAKSIDICQGFFGWPKDAARQLMKELRKKSIKIYKEARTHAMTRGIIIADTKFEFGVIEEEGRKQIVLIDELLTPDSSRFWSLEDFETGRSQDSYDKQILRNYLMTIVDKKQWDMKAPGPSLPSDLKDKILSRYRDIYDRLTK